MKRLLIFIIVILFLSSVRFNCYNTDRTVKEYNYKGVLTEIKNYKLGKLHGPQLQYKGDPSSFIIRHYRNGKESYKKSLNNKMEIPASKEFTLDPYFQEKYNEEEDMWIIGEGRYTFYDGKKYEEAYYDSENKIRFTNYGSHKTYEDRTRYFYKGYRTGYYKRNDEIIESTLFDNFMSFLFDQADPFSSKLHYNIKDGDFVDALYYDKSSDSLLSYNDVEPKHGPIDYDDRVSSQIYFKRTYKDGKLNGLYECFNYKGELLCSGYMIEGEKDGKWTEWEGIALKNYWYQDLEDFNDFTMNVPEIHSTGLYIKSKREGEWEEFYKINTLISKGSYKNNVKEGSWSYHHNNGQLESEGEYKKGLKDGQWIYYDDSGSFLKKEFRVNNNLIK